MDKITVTINGKQIEARPGQTVLEVINEHKIDNIPTLCHDKRLAPYGSCYLCVVEVQGMAKLIPSCASPVQNNMVITTDNERIRKARKTALELLLSNHYADCLGPCRQTCPAGVDVQGYIALIANGSHTDAVRLIKEKNPLPLVCSRVCVRECEAACRRNRVDERVGIDFLKRFAVDIDIDDPWTPELPAKNGKKVAIAGGGPAGLTCAYYLMLSGYSVTLYERSSHLGGMLRYGIPEYRLPKAMLDKEIGWITGMGVEVKLNSSLGKDIRLEDLRKKYDAVFLAFGAQLAKPMGLKDEEKTKGVLPGVDFLRSLQGEKMPSIHGTVVVLGGGNTAIDAARSSVRLGAKKVILLYRRTRKEMPAHDLEITAAIEEGVELMELATPTGIISESGSLKALECVRMELGEPDASGRRSPRQKAGSEFMLPCDFVISAIGQDIDLCGLDKVEGLKTAKGNTLSVNGDTLETTLPGVFCGGDMAIGPSVAIDAIAHGRIAAYAIDKYITTGKAEGKPVEFLSRKSDFGEIPDSEFTCYDKICKEKMPELCVEERVCSMAEVETGFTPDQAGNEASRCLECGCSAFFDCSLRRLATEYGAEPVRYLGEVCKYSIDRSHPFIALDPNKCIECGRCVRTCSDVLKVSALGFVNRGFRSVVKPALEKKLTETVCISCGNCIEACPTGAISESVPFTKPGPWMMMPHKSICNFCSLGCGLEYRVLNEDIFTVGSDPETPNKGFLCTKGRFGYRYMLDKERALKPMIRKNGHLVECSWDEALSAIAAGFTKIIKEKGANAIGVTGSPRLSNEELYLLQGMSRGIFKNNMGSFTRILGNPDKDDLLGITGASASTAALSDIENAGIILTVNSDIIEENLIAGIKIREAQKRGAKLVVISSVENGISKESDLWLDCKPGTSAVLLSGLANIMLQNKSADEAFINNRTKGIEDFRKSVSGLTVEKTAEITGVPAGKIKVLAGLLSDAKLNIISLYNTDHLREHSNQDLAALANLHLVTGRISSPGSGIILLSNYANSQGFSDIFTDTMSAGDGFIRQLQSRGITGLLTAGEDPLNEKANAALLKGLKFLAVADYFITETAKAADVFLPLSLPVESSGTYTACDRRVQRVERVLPPKAGMENIEWIQNLTGKIGGKPYLKSAEEIFFEIEKHNPDYMNVKPGDEWGKDFLKDAFRTKDGKAHFVPMSLDTKPSGMETPVMISSERYVNSIREKCGVKTVFNR